LLAEQAVLRAFCSLQPSSTGKYQNGENARKRVHFAGLAAGLVRSQLCVGSSLDVNQYAHSAEVGEVSNGREAIHQILHASSGVILMHLQIPEKNGVDAIIAIRSEFPEVRTSS
jgi:CheY-like chemotaxis protein